MRQILDRTYSAALTLAATAFAAIGILVLVQVTGRLIDRAARAMGAAPPGITVPSLAEIGGFLFLGAVFLGLAGTFTAGGHVRVTLLTRVLPDAPRRALGVAVAAGAAGLCAFATWSSLLQFLDSVKFTSVSYGMVKIPLAIPQGVMTLGLALLLLAILDAMVVLARGNTPAYEAAEEETG
ncbi:TRAP transporter small permease [Pseudooceanicola aestuarii]|uniref:TRAP transporter small permease n=1 Tax=Pseudooceanicola aestuarii TaxID=2697319 RepID=UPI0013D4809D|nr:TRAP transporter small permease subunit [Pseudooceanicola aestuarii]